MGKDEIYEIPYLGNEHLNPSYFDVLRCINSRVYHGFGS